MNQPDDDFFRNPSADKVLLTFDEARRYHRWQFSQTTIEERIQWLADMLEIMRLAQVAREDQEVDKLG